MILHVTKNLKPELVHLHIALVELVVFQTLMPEQQQFVKEQKFLMVLLTDHTETA